MSTLNETKKFAVGEKLRNGEEAIGGEVSVEGKKNFHPEGGKNPAFVASNQVLVTGLSNFFLQYYYFLGLVPKFFLFAKRRHSTRLF